MLEIDKINDEYGFDVDTCYQIADLAERLGVPCTYFASVCFSAVSDVRSDPCYIPPDIEFALNLGMSSDEEMDAICQYFKCKLYELDSSMVRMYKMRNNSHRKEGA